MSFDENAFIAAVRETLQNNVPLQEYIVFVGVIPFDECPIHGWRLPALALKDPLIEYKPLEYDGGYELTIDMPVHIYLDIDAPSLNSIAVTGDGLHPGVGTVSDAVVNALDGADLGGNADLSFILRREPSGLLSGPDDGRYIQHRRLVFRFICYK